MGDKNESFVAHTIPGVTKLPNRSFMLGPFPVPVDPWTPIYILMSEQRDDEAGDLLFETVNNMCLASEWGRLDRFLLGLDLDRLNTNLMMAALVLTNVAESHLADYHGFFDRVFAKFSDKYGPQQAVNLLKYLRPLLSKGPINE